MQWLLQQFEDTNKLAEALDQLGISYTWHKVVPFVGEIIPEPVVADPGSVVMFGSYTLWKNARRTVTGRVFSSCVLLVTNRRGTLTSSTVLMRCS
ncbi:hypothetical protein DLJ82_1203 [Rhizobium leguminosarum]|uniref:Uncharacterized protein n=1 Tax=Rhizobium leguminosarum TaxID=384 RepID=A0A2Z4YCV4_RHILE|nr:hypothetical protein DLJ82_1203 [Rhizobium leguminosarum]